MTFAQLISSPPDLDTLRGLWLVLDAATATDLAAKQSAHGSPVHRVAPVAGPASDPRFALCADLVSEIQPGGLYHPLFASLDPAKFAAVQVATRAELESAGWFASKPQESL